LTAILIDRRSTPESVSQLFEDLATAQIIGFDIETHDDNAHPGIKAFRGARTTRAFDMQRTIITGFSVYVEGTPRVYYVNVEQADVENRLGLNMLRQVVEAKPAGAQWICHNAPFEITVLRLSADIELTDVICSLQAAVSAYGPDQYAFENLGNLGLGEMEKFMPAVSKHFAVFEGGRNLTSKQGELVSQILGKASRAAHSYNGVVYEASHGYGLKKAIFNFFGFKMATFSETLDGKRHMGELTGDEVLAYGCDDAYWAVRLFMDKLLPSLATQNTKLIKTFFEQENPMIYVYADIWSYGMRVNTQAIAERRTLERARCAEVLRELREAVQAFTFTAEPNELLRQKEKWYGDGAKYRARIAHWVKEGHRRGDLEELQLVNGSVVSGWVQDLGRKHTSVGPNFTHYMVMRTVAYDLLDLPIIYDMGKVASDADARGEMIGRLKASDDPLKEAKIEVITLINELVGVEQRMKLYLNPYSQLTDPDTGRMYPTLSSMLASRRLASSNPNPMQLAKQGESTYVRGFYGGDDEDHLVVAADWSQIELVEIGEFSGDPEFLLAYSCLPYNDLHRVAAAAILSAENDTEVTAEQFASLRSLGDGVVEPFGFPLIDNKGNVLTPKEAYKYNRGTAGGKGANFGYWYSGALGSVGNARGIKSDVMWAMTEQYREKFSVAEEWRTDLIDEVRNHGYVTLPDGHRRQRLEATPMWEHHFRSLFYGYDDEGIKNFASLFVSRIKTRAGNQAVNSVIQGSCATLAKRTILSTRKEIAEKGLRARFMIPVHDELVWSVHKDDVAEFIEVARRHMVTHPDLFKKCVLHCTVAVGRTFEPWHPTRAPYGQVELDEAPAAPFIDPKYVNEELPDSEIAKVIAYMGDQHVG
jgi:DNA polymerase I-like protein with 3'-5' exonuclease and polymerase domains